MHKRIYPLWRNLAPASARKLKRPRSPSVAARGVILLLVVFMVWQWGQALTIHAKALLAQYLVEHSWAQTLAAGGNASETFRPWPWADTWPVSRLQWVHREASGEQIKADLFILAGADSSSLAFGPGHMHGTALPGQGASAIAGHRDTHFKFLQHLKPRDLLRLQDASGRWLSYTVTGTKVVNADKEHFYPNQEPELLYLITCYPFNAVAPGGPLRYVVMARRINAVHHTVDFTSPILPDMASLSADSYWF